MNTNDTNKTTLESWKEIAAYLQRDSRTVRRWEKEEALPVHRHTHNSRHSVYAYPSEIDAWRASRKAAPEPLPLWKTLLAPPRLAFGATLALCLVMVGNGVRPQVASAQARQTTREVWSGDGVEAVSSVSPDGRYLSLYSGSVASGANVAIRDLTTGKDRLLTHHPENSGVGETLISPDGSQVAYTYFTDFATKYELRIVPISGAGATPKTVHQSDETFYIEPVGWTPDGKQLLVMRDLKRDHTIQMAMISIEDSSLRVLKSFGWQGVGQIRLSPDGRYVAFAAPASESDPAHDIFVLAVDGSRETKVVESAAIDWAPIWSPDGSQILFLSDRTGTASLWSVAVNQGRSTGPAQLVKPDVGFIGPLGMTRGGTLYYRSEGWGRRNVYTADLDAAMAANKPPKLVSERFVNMHAAPAWSADGQYLAYYALLAPTREMSGVSRLVIRTVKTGEEHEVRMPQLRVPPYGFAPAPKWFPDGRSVLVASYDQQQPVIGFYRVNIADGKVERIHHTKTALGFGVGQFDLSPDGKSIFYIDVEDPFIIQLMRFDLDQRRETELKRGEAINAVAVSPDSKQVAYAKVDTGFRVTVFEVMPVNGGEPRRIHNLTEFLDYPPLTWSPDQRHLIFATPDKGGVRSQVPWSLWKVPVTGGTPEKMGITADRIFLPRLRPDGRQIAFTSREGTAQAIWALENSLPKAAATK